ncbi:Uncharacterized protein PBTT_08760 [Plasmodiophora brassicae]
MPSFHVDAPYLHAAVPDFSDFGFVFEYICGKRFFMHANVYPNIAPPLAFQGVVESPLDPLPDDSFERIVQVTSTSTASRVADDAPR